ncbi:SusD/RagB family nutrient-binding outer membrane lipoprotein [Arachidicoccus soli]|uniref:SusD/RagB family nutrient-binding outer membrane lipoprotein n=1 Tax=Arachidicoccus soli TaxID=2341117 RepID=A0A386HTN1_9BACT|nr:SusD/RagB family nutrient-binding outer membrane lipoprotein [Arachidicoccus soli]AYD49183.1 SusD/RagB family nutrient-binding outer membrane lipoprotein [Arachidicoccus soli]
MKLYNKNIIVSALVFMSFSILCSCQKQLDINHSPNNPALDLGSPQIVFPGAVLATAAKTGGDLAILGGLWSEYYTQSAVASQYRSLVQYNIQSPNFNSSYTVLMSSGLKNYQYVIDKAKTSEDWNYYLMATVMKAYTTEVLVDLYDQIPYSESLLGQSNLHPKFDDGHTIYLNLLASLDTALAKNLNAPTSTNPGSSDLIFGGKMSNWIAFANTLKLKMYLRMVNKYPSDAENGIKALYATSPSFLTVDAALTGFADQDSKRNPMYEQNIKQLNTPDNLRACKSFVSWLQQNSDPRITPFFGKPNITTVNAGDDNSATAGASTAATFVEHYNDPVEFISAAESYFLQAEANLRYSVGATDVVSYNKGVTQAFSELGLDATSFIALGGAYMYPITGSMADKLQAIITQKWAECAYGCHGIEAYFEKNRTGYPKTSLVYSDNIAYIPGQIVVSKSSVLAAGQLPKRLVFPYVEIQSNPNAPALVPITTPVWWGN